MKKKISAFLALLLVVFMSASGTGCASDGNDGPEEEINVQLPADTRAKLKVAVSNDPAETAIIDALNTEFNRRYPDIEIETVPITNYEQTIMGDIASNIVYDVIWVADSYVTQFANEDVLADLDPYLQASRFDTSLYYDSMIKMGQKNHGGAQYMMPRDYSKIVVYLNKAMFEEFSLPLPQNDWTWTQFLSTCAALKTAIAASANPNRYALEAELDWRIQMYGMTSSYGGVFVDENKQAVLDTAFQKGLSDLQSLVKNGYALFSNKAQDNFIGGKVAMRFQVRPALSSYYSVLGSDLDVAAFPAVGSTPKVGTGTTGYGIGKASRAKNAAWAYLSFMMSKEGQDLISSTGNCVPALKSLGDDPAATWRTIGKYANINHDAFIYEPTRDVVPDYYDMLTSVEATGYDNAVRNMLAKIFTHPNTSVTSAVLDCQLEIEDFLKWA